jgi:hypothetical protein
VAFPLGMLALYYIVFKQLYNKNRETIEGTADTLLGPVDEKDYSMALTTVAFSLLREFVCAITVTFFNTHQFAALIFMYSTLLYLGYLLGYSRFKTGNIGMRIDMFIVLILSYLMIMLSDYV